VVRFVDGVELHAGAERLGELVTPLRGLAIGRRNWLFTGSPAGAEAATRLFSLIGSAQLHGVNPRSYLQALLRRLPSRPHDELHQFLPGLWQSSHAKTGSFTRSWNAYAAATSGCNRLMSVFSSRCPIPAVPWPGQSAPRQGSSAESSSAGRC